MLTNTNTLLACEHCKHSLPKTDKTVFIDLKPQRRQFCNSECWNKFKLSFQPGLAAKDLNWHWGGTVESINSTHIFIRVGNQETGEIYPVTFEKSILIMNQP